MNGISRVALLALLLAASAQTVAGAQESTSDSLRQRIAVLERKTADLEQRVRELEAVVSAKPAQPRPVPASANWKDVANWRRLSLGMTMEQVRGLLGEPEKVAANPAETTWYWDYPTGPTVHFDSRSGKLEGWSEPD